MIMDNVLSFLLLAIPIVGIAALVVVMAVRSKKKK
jgi:hypothetical protein